MLVASGWPADRQRCAAKKPAELPAAPGAEDLISVFGSPVALRADPHARHHVGGKAPGGALRPGENFPGRLEAPGFISEAGLGYVALARNDNKRRVTFQSRVGGCRLFAGLVCRGRVADAGRARACARELRAASPRTRIYGPPRRIEFLVSILHNASSRTKALRRPSCDAHECTTGRLGRARESVPLSLAAIASAARAPGPPWACAEGGRLNPAVPRNS